ncbi:MAG: hypothetical protein AB7N76_11150 [Planctomycetota bacterium]
MTESPWSRGRGGGAGVPVLFVEQETLEAYGGASACLLVDREGKLVDTDDAWKELDAALDLGAASPGAPPRGGPPVGPTGPSSGGRRR